MAWHGTPCCATRRHGCRSDTSSRARHGTTWRVRAMRRHRPVKTEINRRANAQNQGHWSRRHADPPAATAFAHAESPGLNYRLSVQSMSASLPGIVVPSMGIDVGFFSTKYSLGRASGRNGGNILVEQFPSLAPRNFGGSRQLPTAGRQDVVLVEAEPGGLSSCRQGCV